VQFLFYRAQGFLGSVTYLAHVDNLLHLCSNCHRAFDAPIPEIVIIPTDVSFFIDWEKKDYTARCQAANEGQTIPRTVPSSSNYNGTYRAYLPKDSVPLDSRALKGKKWGGSPTAVILKACMGLFQPVVPDIDVDTIDYQPEISPRTKRNVSNRLPSGIRVELAKRMELYSRPMPVARAMKEPSSPPLSPSPGSDEDDPKDKEGPKDKEDPKDNTKHSNDPVRFYSNSRGQTPRRSKGKANTNKGKANTNKSNASTKQGQSKYHQGQSRYHQRQSKHHQGQSRYHQGQFRYHQGQMQIPPRGKGGLATKTLSGLGSQPSLMQIPTNIQPYHSNTQILPPRQSRSATVSTQKTISCQSKIRIGDWVHT
jgi:hypothetical protein